MTDSTSVSSSSQTPKSESLILPTTMTENPNPSMKITTSLFNGQNYLAWSQSLTLFLKSRGKMGYVDGRIQAPSTTDSGYDQWEITNSLIMSWLIHSMVPELGEGYLSMETAQDIWEAVAVTYSRKGNFSQAFELRRSIESTLQGEQTVLQYFTFLTNGWKRLDHLEDYKPVCPTDSVGYKKFIARERVFKFLAGLNMEYDPVRGRVLSMDTLPSLQEAFAYVQNEESRRSAMMSPVSTDRSALLSTPRDGLSLPPPSAAKESVFCDYCKKPRHTRETCWKLHGTPSGGRGDRSGSRGGRSGHSRGRGSYSRAHQSSTVDTLDSTSVTQASDTELEDALRQLLDRRSSTALSTASSSFARSGNLASVPCAFLCHTSLPWIIDSGASDHMSGSSDLFSAYKPSSGQDKVRIADGTVSSISGKGLVQVTPTMHLSSVLHVPKFSVNLLSLSRLTQDLNCCVTFFPDHCLFQDLVTGRTIGSGSAENGLYFLDQPDKLAYSSTTSSTTSTDVWLWHRRLGHPSFHLLKHLFPSSFANHHVSDFLCESCQLGKQHRASFAPSLNKSLVPFSLIHSDVWGPSRVLSVKGHRWFVTFIDDFSRATWVYLMKDKSEVFSVFRTFHKMICTQFGATIKIFRSDNGGEYIDSGLEQYFSTHGIIHQTSCTNTPQQNGVAERKNRHLLDMARCMCFFMNVPQPYWGDAVLTAAHLINRLPTQVLDKKAPLHVLLGSLSLFSIPPKIFGCVCFVHNHSPSRGKLDPRSLKCVFLGYSPTQKGYKCYHPSSRKWFVSMDVTFFESQSYFLSSPGSPSSFPGAPWCEVSPVSPMVEVSPVSPMVEVSPVPPMVEPVVLAPPSSTGTLEPTVTKNKDGHVYVRDDRKPVNWIQGTVSATPLPSPASDESLGNFESRESIDLDVPIAKRKGVRSCTQHPISQFVSYSHLSSSYRAFVSNISSVSIPNHFQDALAISEWKLAMIEEMKALRKNGTWELTELPTGKRPVGCKWVYTVKHKADGSIERYKARLVAKGFTQTYGIDYQETFAPVAKMNSVRALLSLAANLDWPLYQFDVKNAFLHGDLEEEVYMDIPPGFEDHQTEGKVCKLRKSLYGLKQSPRAWFERFTQAMFKYGFKQSQADHTLFVKHSSCGKTTALIVYVDDIVLTGNDSGEIPLLKKYLAKEFEIKDLGSLKYFLGIEVARSKDGIFISQRKYVLDLLKETGMLGCKACATPLEPNQKLGDDEGGEVVDKGSYQRLVGKLIYLSHSRPDIAVAVSIVSQFMHAPRQIHFEAVMRILKYLKSAPGKGLYFSKYDHLRVEAYTDADWAGSVTDRRSTLGYCTFVGGNLVTWRSKKQNVVARSSAEAEFRAMAQGVCELLWIKLLLSDLGIAQTDSMRLYCDNKAAINIAHNPVQHDRTKHVEIDRHFIKEKLTSGTICTPFVQSGDQLADILTKGLGNKPFHDILGKLGMRDIFAPA
ncbi:unnamed protein product [Camellia sinensis]